jgi:hypothetical protein
MKKLKEITIILLVAFALPALAAPPSPPPPPTPPTSPSGVLLQEGLYAEEVDGDLDAAIRIYAQVIKDGTAQRSQIAQAMYRQGMCYLKKQQEQQAKLVFEKLLAEYGDQTNIVNKVKPLLQELSNADPAALMPPDTLAYVEIGSPAGGYRGGFSESGHDGRVQEDTRHWGRYHRSRQAGSAVYRCPFSRKERRPARINHGRAGHAGQAG